MDISEAESGAMPLSRQPVALADVVARALDLYHDVADAKGVALTADIASEVVVLGDRIRLEQVAANLVDNAVKYTPPGGQVVVEIRRDGNQAVLKVRDTGAGIPADELPRIWDRLFPRRRQPGRTRARSWPQPRQGGRRSPRRNGRRDQRARPRFDFYRLFTGGVRLVPYAPSYPSYASYPSYLSHLSRASNLSSL